MSQSRRRQRLRRRALAVTAFFYVNTLMSLGPVAVVEPPTAEARINPLQNIIRQIQKVNMLVVLDTSGSMAWVPGGAALASAPLGEVGMDCDNGVNCRGGSARHCTGQPDVVCLSDIDCRIGRCTASGKSCFQNADCADTPAFCSLTPTVLCTADDDCPEVAGACSVTGAACSTTNPCPDVPQCQYPTSVVGGGQCDPAAVPATTGSCVPRSPGACKANGTTPCDQPTDCPGTCSVMGASCSTTAACAASGSCVFGGAACNADGACAATGTITGGSCRYGPPRTGVSGAALPAPGGPCTLGSQCPLLGGGACAQGGASCVSQATCVNSCTGNPDCPVGRCQFNPNKICTAWLDCAEKLCVNSAGTVINPAYVKCADDTQCAASFPGTYPLCRPMTTACLGYASNGTFIGNRCGASGFCVDNTNAPQAASNACVIDANACDVPAGNCPLGNTAAACDRNTPCAKRCSNLPGQICALAADCFRCSTGDSSKKCSTGSDCRICSSDSSQSCTADAECGASGTCSVTGVSCSATSPCADAGYCVDTATSAPLVPAVACTNPAGPCTTSGTCSVTSGACTTTALPPACLYGASPPGGCTSAGDCPLLTPGAPTSTCSVTGVACTTDTCANTCTGASQCPVGQCKYSPGKSCTAWSGCGEYFCASGSPPAIQADHVKCTGDSQCADKYGAAYTCKYFVTPCLGYNSSGALAGNVCSTGTCSDANTNGCVTPANNCVASAGGCPLVGRCEIDSSLCTTPGGSCSLPTGTCTTGGGTCSGTSACAPLYRCGATAGTCTASQVGLNCDGTCTWGEACTIANGGPGTCPAGPWRCPNNTAVTCSSGQSCTGNCNLDASACARIDAATVGTCANTWRCPNNTAVTCSSGQSCTGTCSLDSSACARIDAATVGTCANTWRCPNNTSITCSAGQYCTGGTCSLDAVACPRISSTNAGTCATALRCPNNTAVTCSAGQYCTGGTCNLTGTACPRVSSTNAGTCATAQRCPSPNTAVTCSAGQYCTGTCSYGATAVATGTCATAPTVTTGKSYSGSTTSTTPSVHDGCNICSGPEAIFKWVPTANGTVNINTSGSTFGHRLYIAKSCRCTSSCGSCIEDCQGVNTCGTAAGYCQASVSNTATITPTVTSGVTYYIYIDGNAAGYYGAYKLNVGVAAGAACKRTSSTTTDVATACTAGASPTCNLTASVCGAAQICSAHTLNACASTAQTCSAHTLNACGAAQTCSAHTLNPCGAAQTCSAHTLNPCASTAQTCGLTANACASTAQTCSLTANACAQAANTCTLNSNPCGTVSDSCSAPSSNACSAVSNACAASSTCVGGQNNCAGLPICNAGTCGSTGITCNGPESCSYPANSCMGGGNTCTWAPDACDKSNPCVIRTQQCNQPRNTCAISTTNTCTSPVPANDTCGPKPLCNLNGDCPPYQICQSGFCEGALGMCHYSNTVCLADSTCLTACSSDGQCKGGARCNLDPTSTTYLKCSDWCGPATSRAVVAKHVLRDVTLANSNLVNFGLMTFWQSGYFPYYKGTSTTSTRTITEFETRGKLKAMGCYTKTGGPTSTCPLGPGGALYYLATAGGNSAYRMRAADNDWKNFPMDWSAWPPDCNQDEFCKVRDGSGAIIGTGKYAGSYYTYTVTGRTETSGQICRAPTYQGKAVTSLSGSGSCGVNDYTYWTPRTDYYNAQTYPPISGTVCEGTCSQQCGGRWDTNLAPFLDWSGVNTVANSVAMSKNFDYAMFGGLGFWWGTPTGCTLENDTTLPGGALSGYGATDMRTVSAYHYMENIHDSDPLSAKFMPGADGFGCRKNFIVLITDGEANGPGDIGACTAAACDAMSNPSLAGCACRSVLAAKKTRDSVKTRTYVVNFGADVASPSGTAIANNIAHAGGTSGAYSAINQQQLLDAVQKVIFDAVAGSYATSQSSSSSASVSGQTVTSGNYILDARADFPSWQGHLMAYNVNNPALSWDAHATIASMNWWQRRLFVRPPASSQTLVQIAANPSSAQHEITNASALYAYGFGASWAEADKIARWAMGDPAMKNPAVLGAVTNSTAIDVGQPGDNPLPGGHAFYLKYRKRPNILFFGADDGMLHAVFTHDVCLDSSKSPPDRIWSAVAPADPNVPCGSAALVHRRGSEAFAFIPNNMISVITKLYAQGGQAGDPHEHYFGVAGSPKVKNICVADCNGQIGTPDWRTILISGEGFGGGGLFALDVTEIVDLTTGQINSPTQNTWNLLFDTSIDHRTEYSPAVGQAISVPGFFLQKDAQLDKYRLIFGSGYQIDPAMRNQGSAIVVGDIWHGSASVPGGMVESTLLTPGTCSIAPASRPEYTLLADMATARDYAGGLSASTGEQNKLLCAYLGDTWGNIWRYQLNKIGAEGAQGSLGQAGLVAALGCQNPLHFAPTVVQLDRDNPSNRLHEVYLVQATNSPLDDVTAPLTTDYPASKLVIRREIPGGDGYMTADGTFNNSTGSLTLTVGTPDICTVDPIAGACPAGSAVPADARPMSTPLGVLKAGGSGFQIISTWYRPDPQGCTKGDSWITVHSFSPSGGSETITQLKGMHVVNASGQSEPVASTVVIGSGIFVATSTGMADITASLGLVLQPSWTSGGTMGTGAEVYRTLGWQEIP